jgi:hypothetical protein
VQLETPFGPHGINAGFGEVDGFDDAALEQGIGKAAAFEVILIEVFTLQAAVEADKVPDGNADGEGAQGPIDNPHGQRTGGVDPLHGGIADEGNLALAKVEERSRRGLSPCFKPDEQGQHGPIPDVGEHDHS